MVPQSTRQAVLERDGGKCFRCGRAVGGRVPFNIHHRLSARHGPDTPDNLITLCGFGNNLHDPDGEEWCHGWAHQNGREAKDAGGWIMSRHGNIPPELVPVLHHKLGWVLLTTDFQITDQTGRGLTAYGQEDLWTLSECTSTCQPS